MAEPRTEPEQFNWRLPLRAALCAPIVMLLLFIWAGDPALNYVFVIVPVICLCCLFCLVLFAFAALRKKQSRSLSMLLALVAFLVVSGALLRTQGVIRRAPG
jgi:thiol:disulfide interchange protein